MGMRTAVYSTLTVVALIAGCAPYPHRFYSRPDIEGALSVAGSPVRNAEVLVGTSTLAGQPCKDAVAVARTNEGGEFIVAGRNHVDMLYSFLNPPALIGQLTSICFRPLGELVLFGAQVDTPTNKPSRVIIVCAPTLPKQRSPLGEPQICR